MSVLVIDASIALKWVVCEPGTEAALALRRSAKLLAPELMLVECANILCKKVARGELTRDEALLAARLLHASGVEFVPTRALLEAAMLIAFDIGLSASACVHVALAAARNCRLVTADAALVRSASKAAKGAWADRVISLHEAAAG
jgi:predicted nucleic acid-binding protein